MLHRTFLVLLLHVTSSLPRTTLSGFESHSLRQTPIRCSYPSLRPTSSRLRSASPREASCARMLSHSVASRTGVTRVTFPRDILSSSRHDWIRSGQRPAWFSVGQRRSSSPWSETAGAQPRGPPRGWRGLHGRREPTHRERAPDHESGTSAFSGRQKPRKADGCDPQRPTSP